MAVEIAVTINGPVEVTFNDYTAGPPAYLLRNTPRLFSTLSTRQTKSEKQGAHGVFDSLSFYNERVLPFEGEILGASQADRKAKEDALRACLALPTFPSYAGDDGYLLVQFTDEDGVQKQCYAKVVEPPAFEVLDDADPSRRGFGFVMLAKDPFLYAAALETAAGGVVVTGTNFKIVSSVAPTVPFQLYENTDASLGCTNAGTIDAAPLIVIDGPTTDPVVTSATSGVFMALDGLSLLAGERVEIDVNALSVTKYDAADVATDASGYLTSASGWITLRSGANSLSLTDATTVSLAATLTVKWRNTYL